MTVVVTGLSIVSALGQETSQIWQRLMAGESAIALHQPFAELAPAPMAMISKEPARVDGLLLKAITIAIQDAGLSLPMPQCGVVIGSSRGHQAQWERSMVAGQPLGWLSSLPHMGALAVARYIGATGPVLAPMAACATGLWAIAQGYYLLQSGQCERVVVGAGEAAITPLTLSGFIQMRAMAHTGCYPFDYDREGLALGEGAAVMVLETAKAANDRGAQIYGQVLGMGLTADANHVTAPDAANQQGGLAGIKACLQQSHLQPTQVSFIHAHGTGTPLNDAYEASLLQAMFPKSVLVTGTKGALGHTLGASGAIGAVICLLALHYQCLPPCVGLRRAAFDLNLVRQAMSTKLSTALCFSFGFGGQNAVVAFSR